MSAIPLTAGANADIAGLPGWANNGLMHRNISRLFIDPVPATSPSGFASRTRPLSLSNELVDRARDLRHRVGFGQKAAAFGQVVLGDLCLA
jgi:hypothetical protein